MSLTQDQIEKLSKSLSKIWVDNEKIADGVNNVLNYIDLLNEVETTWVQPTVSVIETNTKLRDDILEEPKEIKPEELLACSNQKVVANQIAISNIMN